MWDQPGSFSDVSSLKGNDSELSGIRTGGRMSGVSRLRVMIGYSWSVVPILATRKLSVSDQRKFCCLSNRSDETATRLTVLCWQSYGGLVSRAYYRRMILKTKDNNPSVTSAFYFWLDTGSLLNHPSGSPRRSNRSRDWTELNWTGLTWTKLKTQY